MSPIAVIPKSTTHVFWRAVEAGAREGAKEAGVEMIWKGSLKEDDPAQQIQIVQQFVSEGVGGIVLAPIDETALRGPVAAATQKGIPVVIMDSPLKGEPLKDFVCMVSTNNHRAGEIAGEQLGELLHSKGTVAILRYLEICASTSQREAGCLEAIEKFPDIGLFSTIAPPARPSARHNRQRWTCWTSSKRRTEFSVQTNRPLSASCLRSGRITWRAARSSSASTLRQHS